MWMHAYQANSIQWLILHVGPMFAYVHRTFQLEVAPNLQDLDAVLKHGELRMLTDREFNFFKSALQLGHTRRQQ